MPYDRFKERKVLFFQQAVEISSPDELIMKKSYLNNWCSSSYYDSTVRYGPRRDKTCLRWVANNKGGEQSAYPRSLISTFVNSLIRKYKI